MDRAQLRETVCAALSDRGWANALFAHLDPLDPDFGARLRQSVAEIGRDRWRPVRCLMSSLEEGDAIRNAWVAVSSNPTATALLVCAVRSDAGASGLAIVAALWKGSDASLRNHPLAACIVRSCLGETADAPDLTDSIDLKHGLRIRYSLACTASTGSSALALIRRAANVRGASAYVRARELSRFLHHPTRSSARVRLLSAAQYLALTDHERKALEHDKRLPALLLQPKLRAVANRKQLFDSEQAQARTAFQLAQEAVESFLASDLARLAQALEALGPSELATECLRSQFNQASLAAAAGKPGLGSATITVDGWTPLAAVHIRRLRELHLGLEIPRWWKDSGPVRIKQHLRGRVQGSKLSNEALGKVLTSMSVDDRLWLIRNGLGEVLPMEDAAWASASVAEIVSGFRNREAWQLSNVLCRCASATAILDALQPETDPQTIVAKRLIKCLSDPRASASSLALKLLPWVGTDRWAKLPAKLSQHRALATAAVNHPECRFEDAEAAGEALTPTVLVIARRGGRPKVVDYVVEAPPKFARRIAAALKPTEMWRLLDRTDCPDVLRGQVGAQLAQAATRKEFHRLVGAVSSGRQLATLLRLRPDLLRKLPWSKSWDQLPPSKPKNLLALVLAAHGNGRKLSSLSAHVAPSDFVAALSAVQRLLPVDWTWERARLELLSCLGPDCAGRLFGLLALRSRDAGPGRRLDASYREYLRPKKRGGTRAISVPSRSLKFVQRRIYDVLLEPLGAHPAAYGFVPGRNIRDNAAVHVGQRVVSNVDVSNCFPSVRWQLVLGTLRRDLAPRLSRHAISLVVDLCTGRGGLPIGAPTSPAILNRVLLRTDEILSEEAARRGCRYSRYADDLTFSGDRPAVDILGVARRTLQSIGLELDEEKTTIYRPGRRQIVTGLVVNQRVSVPRRIRRRLRAAVHRLSSGGIPHWHGAPASAESIRGRVAFVSSIHPEEGARLVALLEGDGAAG